MSLVQRNPARLITSPIQILRELAHSKAHGNVLGIWAAPYGENMCLTAVEDVKHIDGYNGIEKLIILKKYDLQGIYMIDHEILLSEIRKVRPFKRKYSESIALFDRFENTHDEKMVKIRRLEQGVSIHELEIILVRIINSGYRIAIHLRHDAEVFASSCYVISFESGQEDVIHVSSEINGHEPRKVSIDDIASIEFDFFFVYKGLSSKIFRVL